jgi:UDP-N-acetyl-D-mannosaminuronate dehydrogenase
MTGEGSLRKETKDSLIKELKDKKARVAILGLGYVGLPLAVVFGEAGFNVTGIDPDARKVEALNKGVSYIPDVKDGGCCSGWSSPGSSAPRPTFRP